MERLHRLMGWLPVLALAGCGARTDLDAPTVLLAPRPVAPLSTTTVTSQHPTLRWALATGLDGAHVTLCRDRACTVVEQSFDATGTHGVVPNELAPGVHYWKLTARADGVTGTATSPTWEFFVGHRSAPVDTSWGSVPDFNGDGYADAVVGAPDTLGRVGRVYVYDGHAAGVATSPDTTLAGPGETNGGIGGAVASAGDVNGDGFADLVAGAYAGGRVYVYFGGAAGVATSPSLVLTEQTEAVAYGETGCAVAGVGDLNGDGYADLAVGTLSGMPGTGHVAVYYGSALGPRSTPDFVWASPDEDNSSELPAVAGAGDVNGDGYGDLLVGDGDAASPPGGAFVFLGGPMGISPAPTFSFSDREGYFGYAAASGGDVNGDGFADLVVGAPSTDPVGSAFVHFGSAAGPMQRPSTYLSFVGPENFGGYVASAGDVNADGYSDLVIGPGGYLFLGGPTGTSMTPIVLTDPAMGNVNSPVPTHNLDGRSAGVGDLNGDGFDDVIVGEPLASGGAGAAYIFLGNAGSISTTPDLTLSPPDPSLGNYGYALARSL